MYKFCNLQRIEINVICIYIYISMDKIEDLDPQQDVGLYRDDGLAVTSLVQKLKD